MQSALYYPFINPERESFLKTALLLWDTVDFIVPFRGFRPRGRNPQQDEALELIGRSYLPTREDKRAAHEELEKICNAEFAERFAFELKDPPGNFYPQKLLPETWDLLAESRLAQVARHSDEISRASTRPLFGYYMMSILAVCCARNRKRLVTDNHDPYKALARVLVDEAANTIDRADWHGRLLAISLNGPDVTDIPLANLIRLRKQEDQLLQALRRSFLSRVDQTAAEICANASNPNTVCALIDEFSRSTELDMKELKLALGRAALSTLLSKEFGFSICAFSAGLAGGPATAGWSTVAGSVATVGGLTRNIMNYQDRRREILREHPSSWLFAAGSPRMILF